MAIDVYLQLDGVKGESSDAEHEEWIECQSVNWSITQPKSATRSTARGHSAERCEMSEVSIFKIADLASPVLAQMCACGKTIPKARIEMLRADGNGDRVKYSDVELQCTDRPRRPRHSRRQRDGGEHRPEVPQGKVEILPAADRRRAGGNTAGGWDLATNRVAA